MDDYGLTVRVERIERIDVEQRSGDFMAFLNGDRRLWGAGKNVYEAVGSAVWAHAARHGIVTTCKSARQLQEEARAEHAATLALAKGV